MDSGMEPVRLRLVRSMAVIERVVGSNVMNGQEQWWVEELHGWREDEGSDVMEDLRARRAWYSGTECDVAVIGQWRKEMVIKERRRKRIEMEDWHFFFFFCFFFLFFSCEEEWEESER